MVEWKSKKLFDIVPEDELNALLDVMEAAEDQLRDATDTLVDVVNNAKAFMVESLDPVREVLNLVIEEINNFIQDFLSAGGYVLVVPPRLYGQRADVRLMLGESMPDWWPLEMDVEEFIRTTKEATYDGSDPNRPRFTTSSLVAGVAMMFVATPVTPEEVLDFIVAAEYFLGKGILPELKRIVREFQSRSEASITNATVAPQGAATVTGVDFSDPSAPVVTVSDPDAFLPEGYVWIGYPRTASGRRPVKDWRSSMPVQYHLKSGNKLFLDPGQTKIGYYRNDANSVPQVGDWAVMGGGYLPLSNFSAWSRPPDWNRVVTGAQTFTPVYDIVLNLQRAEALAEVGLAGADAMEKVAELMQQRVQAFSDLVDQARALIDTFRNLVTDASFHYVIMDESTGIDGFLNDLTFASSRPDLEENALSVGAVFLGNVPAMQAIKRLVFPDD